LRTTPVYTTHGCEGRQFFPYGKLLTADRCDAARQVCRITASNPRKIFHAAAGTEFFLEKTSGIQTDLELDRHLGKNSLNDLSVNVGEAHVTAAVAVRQLLVIQAQQVQDRGVQVKDSDDVFH